MGYQAMAGEKVAIVLQGVTKTIDKRFMFGPINLGIPEGFVTAVVGPNGSGKSTLFRLAMNILKPDGGSVSVLNGKYPQEETLVKKRIGYVPDFTDFKSIARTVGGVGDFYADWYPDWDMRRFHELLEQFQLERGMKLKSLSKGMERKLAFSLALAHDPQLLILDEPTSGMDPMSCRLAEDILQRFMEAGERTILIATHSMEEVKRLADYLVFLTQGKIMGVHEKDGLLDRWRRIWVERMPEDPGAIPGVAALEINPSRLITSNWRETEAELRNRDIRITHTQSLELDELAGCLLKE